MLPNSEHLPASGPQIPVYFTIARLVAHDLRTPIILIGCGVATVLWTEVPETPVYENGDALLGENEIGTSGERQMSSPANQSMLSQNGQEYKFCFLVSLRRNRSHYLGAFPGVKYIRHGRESSPNHLASITANFTLI